MSEPSPFGGDGVATGGAVADGIAAAEAQNTVSSASGSATRRTQSLASASTRELHLSGEGSLGSFVLEVDAAQDLGGFETTVSFDPSVIQIESVEMSAFLASTGRTMQPLGPDIDNEHGTLTFGAWTLGADAGPDGTATLAEVTVSVRSCPGSLPLDLESRDHGQRRMAGRTRRNRARSRAHRVRHRVPLPESAVPLRFALFRIDRTRSVDRPRSRSRFRSPRPVPARSISRSSTLRDG
ncbi:MAG: cohesin domain-containing protein [Candidatus Eisenbacteria bacterium]